ncbi:hypothetical protein D3C72_1375880 [compost metagenome]
MPGRRQVLLAGPEEEPPDGPVEAVLGLAFDDQAGLLDQAFELIALEHPDMVRVLEIGRRGQLLLHAFAQRIGHRDQVLRTGTPDPHQLAHELAGVLDMLEHFHRHHLADPSIGQRDRVGIGDQGHHGARRGTLQRPLHRRDLVGIDIGEDHLGAPLRAELHEGAVTAADIQHRVFRANRKALEQLIGLLAEPAAQRGIGQRRQIDSVCNGGGSRLRHGSRGRHGGHGFRGTSGQAFEDFQHVSS